MWPALALATAISCAPHFILRQPCPVTVKASNTVDPLSTSSNGSPKTDRPQNISPRFARIEIIESIAVVHLEVQRWSGKLAGANTRASDVFTLLKCNGDWKITHKLFNWHDQ